MPKKISTMSFQWMAASSSPPFDAGYRHHLPLSSLAEPATHCLNAALYPL